MFNFIKPVLKGAVFTLPFLTAFMDKVMTFSFVSGISMQPILNPTGLNADWILIKRWQIDDRLLQKGDVVSFESPREPGTFMIKRVKALEDELIYDTVKQRESRVPKGHVWLEGDNKRASYDSRHFGYVARGLVTGQALCVIWPPKRFGIKLNTSIEIDDDGEYEDIY